MKIRVLIVDDERIAREGIRRRLENFREAEIIGECANGVEAVAAIKTCKPDLAFLDVQMPGLDGFGVVEKVGAEVMPAIIFVTAYDRYALRAFEVHAFDYLLKPFDEERFNRAFQRAKAHLSRIEGETVNQRLDALIKDLRQRQGAPQNSKAAEPLLERLPIKSAGRIFFISTEEIDWIEAADNYVEIHVGRESHLLREKISYLESRLDPNKFLRIHRSLIVNVKSIKELQPLSHNVFAVILKTGKELTSGRRFRENFRSLLNE